MYTRENRIASPMIMLINNLVFLRLLIKEFINERKNTKRREMPEIRLYVMYEVLCL